MTEATGFLHPGAMGATVAATCSGERFWVSTGRSDTTAARADAAGLHDAGTLEALVERVDTIVSICPPASAHDVARTVAARGFAGTYVDANAIAPAKSVEISELFDRYVDGGIIGPPATVNGTTRMYLSGRDAEATALRWVNSALDVRVIGNQPGAASALKMAYAAWTKGRSALLLAVNALADAYEIGEPLATEWDLSQPGLMQTSEATARGVAPKAWRFQGEMHEIAATFKAANLPDGFHHAAAEIYRRLAELQHVESPDLDTVIEALRTT